MSADDLAALGQLPAHDVDAGRAARIRGACHAGLRALSGRGAAPGPRRRRLAWRTVEPLFASGFGALYLLAVLQRAVLLLAG